MAKQMNKLNFEEIRFKTSASPAEIDRETEKRIERFRNTHMHRGTLALAAFNKQAA